MTYYNLNCTLSSRTCPSGCCQTAGTCATLPGECRWTYSDFYTNTTKYYWPGYANSACASYAKNCPSGCCGLYGGCAGSSQDCFFQYTDFYTNSSKYSFGTSSTTVKRASVNAGPLAGGIVGGVVLLIVIIGLIVWWKKKKAAEAIEQNTAMFNTTGDHGTTIVMTNPTQPVYGMGQPQPLNPPAFTQPFQPAYQQPFQPPQPNYFPSPFGGPIQQPGPYPNQMY